MDYSKLLRIFSDKLTEANEIYINEKLSQLGFDKTRRGKVVSVNGTNCVVEINGEEFNCKLRRGIYVESNDIVFVKFPQDSSVDKYVDAILGGNETPENLVISAQEILDKLKTVDGDGSGLDADFLDGKHASEFATLDDLGDIDVDISGEAIVININESQSIIDDKNLSENVNDAIDKKHSHTNKVVIDNIAQDDIDTWDDVINKANKEHMHTESDIIDLDKYTKAEVDIKLNLKANESDIPVKLSDLNKDINFDERYYTETEMNTLLEDKVDNSRVLTDVPANAKFTDTITSINGKTGVITKADIVALGIPAQDTNTTYSEISTAEIDAGTSSTLRTITGRRVKYILDKVQGWIDSVTKADVGLGNVDNVKQASKTEFDAHNNDNTKHITNTERNNWNNKAEISDIPTKVSELTNDSNYVTQGELGDAGFGNMVKAVYDTNNNGIVDNAEKVNGFTVGTNVPANAKFTDTIYTHPSSHPASMVTESTTKRFVSDTEKSTWNNKANTSDIPDKFIYVGTTSPANNQMGWIDTSL